MNKPLAGLALVGMCFFGLANTAMAQDVTTFTASLNGANEVGDAGGDTDGTGAATITIDVANTQVCFDFSTANIDAIAGGHIHTGGAGSNGDVVVDFGLDASTTKGCVASDTATVNAIVNTPELFYMNLHNEAFPGGAIRGQLQAPVAVVTAETTAEAEVADDSAAAETTTTDAGELAFTGAETGVLAIMGAALVMSGSALVIASRRKD